MTPFATDSVGSDALTSASPIPASAEQDTTALSAARDTVLATHQQEPCWLAHALEKIRALGTLAPNWDSYGACRVDRGSLDASQTVLVDLSRFVGVEEPTITATPDGHVGFCWDDGARSLDASIAPDGLISYVFLNHRDERDERDSRTHEVNTIAVLLTRWPEP